MEPGKKDHTQATVLPSRYVGLVSLFASLLIIMALPKYFSILSLAPLFYILATKAHVSVMSGIIVATMWCVWQSLLLGPFLYFFAIDLRFLFLFFYMPIVVLLMRKSENHSWLTRFIIIYFFDPPLLISAQIINFFGGRLLTPFITEMDENILISSLPFNSDLETLKMHNVGAVVNMCIEYAGPNYPESIVQLRLPTVDTSAPCLADLEKGIQFIASNLEQGKRVLIHCKGGRARAGTMALCYFLKKNPHQDAHEIIHWMTQKRNVIVPFIADYEVVRDFINKHIKHLT